MTRRFKGRPITKEIIALGVAGQIERDDDVPEIPENGRVKFTAEADYDNLKYKFEDDGTVKETLILTIDSKTFAIVEVTEKPKTEELPLDGQESGAEELVDA